jgi:hypothetical protein
MPEFVELFLSLAAHQIDTSIGKIFARTAGSRPLPLLLHGYTETHVMWHRVAPRVKGWAIDSGHVLIEENPEETSKALIDFFSA